MMKFEKMRKTTVITVMGQLVNQSSAHLTYGSFMQHKHMVTFNVTDKQNFSDNNVQMQIL